MIKVGLIGLGKMGISHLSILGAHPDVKIVGVCDTSKMIVDALVKYSDFPGYLNYQEMLTDANPDAVFVAAPTKYHAEIVRLFLQNGKHIFAEKPFCLTTDEGLELIKLTRDRDLVNQVGYHNKFIGTFKEAKKLMDNKFLGEIF